MIEEKSIKGKDVIKSKLSKEKKREDLEKIWKLKYIKSFEFYKEIGEVREQVRVLFCFHCLFLILILYKKLLMLNELINHHRFQLQNNGLLNILFFLSIFTLNLGNDIKNHNIAVRSRCPVEKLLWLHLP